ncbi:PP2C family protein-serine/threonine phosphatase [Allobranchiibius huperziae]|uniref:Protein phosphatase n=1 Tax=Allobranchiibius huperziae TaxID=1874116 RepID=A0A853DFR4_9MICO|nr:protein phosphatase 2C domain-containing protein [Allobranchiibius huperziae]NYJ76376.1 protein phosphatase [Allobranchiibius huperziae]
MPIALRYAARTDLGLGSKTRNEDSGYAGPDLLVLADGMGGHAAGDMASSTVVAELVHLDGESYGADEALAQLHDAVVRANERLRDEMDEQPDLEGMGTTLIAFLRSGNKLAMANIGDSRAYLVRGGVFTQITKDHSLVQALLDDGRITEAEAEHHPQRSFVTRVLTGRADDEPDLSLREAQVGDRYLMCSDGLSDYVAKSTIEDIVTSQGTPGEIADRLIAIALKASARDNVTVVVADVVDSAAPTSATPQVVGAAGAPPMRPDDTPPPEPRTPAEKAAALSREANGPAPGSQDEQDDEHETPVLAEEGPSRFRRLRWLGLGLLVVAIIAVGGWIGYSWTQSQYYVGDDHGSVAIYRGLHNSIGPFHLHSVRQHTDVKTTDLPSYYQSRVRATIGADDLPDARKVVQTLTTQAAACRSQASSCST